MTPELARRMNGRPFLLVLDIDGTLSPIAPRPSDATISTDMRRVLDDLARTPGVFVAAISGRSAHDARRLVSLDEVWIIGNHGMEVAPPFTAPSVPDDVARYAEAIATASARAADLARDRPGVIVEDKRWTLSIHYRLAERRDVPGLSIAVAELARALGLRLTFGKEVLELRPPVAIDKGTAALELAATLGALSDGASLLCAGDDQTDEDMFRALRASQQRSITVLVGDDPAARETSAEFYLATPADMQALLVAVLELSADRPPSWRA